MGCTSTTSVEIGVEADEGDDWLEIVEIEPCLFEEIEAALDDAWALLGERHLCFVSWGPFRPY